MTRKVFQQYVGNLSQVMGAQKSTIDEGLAKGNSIIRVRNGLGLDFNVTPDRGLDIFDIYYKGTPLAWISRNGLVGNQHFDSSGLGWLRSFQGGMLSTCGLRNVGPPVEDDGEKFGLHGRISNIPATNIGVKEYWIDDAYYIEVSGNLREANTFGENLVLHRSIKVNNRKNEIKINDTVTNQGYRPEQVMLLYHLNWGFPVLNSTTELVLDVTETTMRNPDQQPEISKWKKFTEPVPGYKEVVYFHDLKPDANGHVGYTLKNKPVGISVEVNWPKKQLPYFTQWKMMGQAEYVLGLEPGNCYPQGRIEEINNNRSVILEPDQQISAQLNIRISSF